MPEPRLAHFNPHAARLLDLDAAWAQRDEFLATMAGIQLPAGAEPIATVYAGHQFGIYVPQLGDGRAILLGQVRNARGELWDVQLKGAGRTPFSRFADGRAVLRSTIREYLASEAMHALGIPTTRALCVIASPEPVQRETLERAAILCRLAPTHLRFGHFEYFYHLDQAERLAPLADHVIEEYFPRLAGQPDRYRQWIGEVIARNARLVAQWMAVGFVHGVMNTDNCSLLGLTLDYGPYGFMDRFDAHRVFNHTDQSGRYAYDRQPTVMHWNCARFVNACLPLLSADEDEAIAIATELIDGFGSAFSQAMMRAWRAKLGLREARDADSDLVNRFLRLLYETRADFTQSFRRLAQVRCDQASAPPALSATIPDAADRDTWVADYRARLRAEGGDDAERAERMNAVNPKYVLRTHLLQRAIERAEGGDFDEIARLFALMQRPYDEQPEMQAYAEPPSSGAEEVPLSCSS